MLHSLVNVFIDFRVGFEEVAMIRDLRVDRSVSHFLGDGGGFDAGVLKIGCDPLAR